MKWVSTYAPLYKQPGGPAKHCDIPAGRVVEPTPQGMALMAGVGAPNPVDWQEVTYEVEGHVGANAFKGWVYTGYIEEVCNEFPLDAVAVPPQPSRAANDPGQDILWLGRKQFNLCGEFCVAYLAGDSIANMLTQWQPKAPSIFNRVFRILAHGADANLSRPTGTEEVKSMLAVYNKQGVDVNTLLLDPVKKSTVVSPGRFAAVTRDYDIILGVKMDAATGNIRGQGVGHWICVTEVKPDGRNRGWVTFYNPFPNQMQRESWGTLVNSMHAPYGLAVKRGQ